MHNWNQGNGDASHSARSSFDLDKLALVPYCIGRVDGHIISAPLATDGTIFVYYEDAKSLLLAGISMESGAVVWQHDVGMYTGGYSTAGVVRGSRLYSHDGQGVAARELSSGRELARVPNDDEWFGTCSLSSDSQRLYFHDQDARLWAVDRETLEPVWTVRRRSLVSYMAPAIRQGLVIARWIGMAKTHIGCFESETGEVVWQLDLQETTKGVCAVDDRFVYFPHLPGGSVAAYDLETGQEAWRYQARRWPERSFDSYLGLCLGGNRLLHLISPDACEALDPADGKLLWRSEIASPCNGHPIAGSTSAIVATNSGSIHRIALEDGRHAGVCSVGEEVSLPISMTALGPVVATRTGGLWLIS